MTAPDRHFGRLDGRVAIVTGGGGDGGGTSIGKAIALLLAAEGAQVCVADHDRERATHSVALIRQAGGAAIEQVVDVASDAACHAAVAATVAAFGRMDILVNNVGIAKPGGLDAFDEPSWSRIVDVNLKGALLMARHAIPAMTANGGGAIVNVASITAVASSGGGLFAYGPSKAALLALTRDIAVQYGRSGIRANSVVPGYVHTPLVAQPGERGAAQRALRRRIAPLDREGDAWDVAQAVLFLAGPESGFITGAALPVDGGVTAVSALKAHEFAGG